MKIKCEYCGSMINDSMEKCPFCGATNENVVRSTSDQPATIEGLKQWYRDRGLPPYDVTRFFIGENHIGARAFGIYADGDNFVVYKNKEDGSRVIRYKGTDEAYAVNELLQRLKQEILEQKAHSIATAKVASETTRRDEEYRLNEHKPNEYRSSEYRTSSTGVLRSFIGAVIILLLFFVPKIINGGSYNLAKDGYYRYNNYVYYHDSYKSEEAWYKYDQYNSRWSRVYGDIPGALKDEDKREDFYFTPVWDSATQYTDFKTTSTAASSHNSLETEYNRNHASSNDWSDSGSSSIFDWDSGSSSWDSGNTDWNSDW